MVFYNRIHDWYCCETPIAMHIRLLTCRRLTFQCSDSYNMSNNSVTLFQYVKTCMYVQTAVLCCRIVGLYALTVRSTQVCTSEYRGNLRVWLYFPHDQQTILVHGGVACHPHMTHTGQLHYRILRGIVAYRLMKNHANCKPIITSSPTRSLGLSYIYMYPIYHGHQCI